LKTNNNLIFYLNGFIASYDITNDYFRYYDNASNKFTNDIIESLRIEKWNNIEDYYIDNNIGKFEVILDTNDEGYRDRGRTEIMKSSGGSKASLKKYINGKMRCIYKIAGSRKEYIKYKGHLVSVSDYKKYMKI